MRNTQNTIKTIKTAAAAKTTKFCKEENKKNTHKKIFLFEEQQQNGKYIVIKPNLFPSIQSQYFNSYSPVK